MTHSGPATSAHRTGSGRFFAVRASSIALLFFSFFAVSLAVSLIGANHAGITETLGRPFIALPLFGFVVVATTHMYLGLAEIIRDYLRSPLARRLALFGDGALSLTFVGGAGYALITLMLKS